jgi:hypothetical protein
VNVTEDDGEDGQGGSDLNTTAEGHGGSSKLQKDAALQGCEDRNSTPSPTRPPSDDLHGSNSTPTGAIKTRRRKGGVHLPGVDDSDTAVGDGDIRNDCDYSRMEKVRRRQTDFRKSGLHGFHASLLPSASFCDQEVKTAKQLGCSVSSDTKNNGRLWKAPDEGEGQRRYGGSDCLNDDDDNSFHGNTAPRPRHPVDHKLNSSYPSQGHSQNRISQVGRRRESRKSYDSNILVSPADSFGLGTPKSATVEEWTECVPLRVNLFADSPSNDASVAENGVNCDAAKADLCALHHGPRRSQRLKEKRVEALRYLCPEKLNEISFTGVRKPPSVLVSNTPESVYHLSYRQKQQLGIYRVQ